MECIPIHMATNFGTLMAIYIEKMALLLKMQMATKNGYSMDEKGNVFLVEMDEYQSYSLTEVVVL